MNYISTRNITGNADLSSACAIKNGLAADGGLYMPETIPTVNKEKISELAKMSYCERASEIISLFLTDYDREKLEEDCALAYSKEKFGPNAAPVVKISDKKYMLELWHGPTCAFKDMALQIMPRLLSRALAITGENKTAHILVATSGDTGKAALEGYRDVPQTKITVFYPRDGVSDMQKLQMATQLGENVCVCSVNGNFDDAQTGVKRIFSNDELAKKAEKSGFFFSSANSINWGRLVPQIVYYFSAYCDLVNSGEIKLGDKVNFCVPTGNFGNIFAGFIAKKMGLPVRKFICASNSNRVLTDFINNGTYDRTREFFKTISPSMDILISSNLERLLWLICDAKQTSEYMESLANDGKYTVSEETLSKIKDEFAAYSCTEEETEQYLKTYFDKYGYLADTHTSVAIGAYEKYISDTEDNTKTVIVSTASPYKFPEAVCASLGKTSDNNSPEHILSFLEKTTETKAPETLKSVLTLPMRFKKAVEPCEMANILFE